jgi:hypothetical protein
MAKRQRERDKADKRRAKKEKVALRKAQKVSAGEDPLTADPELPAEMSDDTDPAP